MRKPIGVALSAAAVATVVFGLVMGWPPGAAAQGIIEEWNSVKAPPPPLDKIKPVKIDAKKTAVLSLDWNARSCTEQSRVRCFRTLPKIEKLLKDTDK